MYLVPLLSAIESFTLHGDIHKHGVQPCMLLQEQLAGLQAAAHATRAAS